jgi:four helix bundle protein
MEKQNEFIISKQKLRSGISICTKKEKVITRPSKKDSVYKISIVNKEARETKYWKRLLDKLQIVPSDFKTNKFKESYYKHLLNR